MKNEFVFCKIENYFCPPRKNMIYSIKKENIDKFLDKLKNIYNVILYMIKDNKLYIVIYNSYFYHYNHDVDVRKKEINSLINNKI